MAKASANPNAAVRFLDRTTPPHIFSLVLIAGMAALTMSIFLPAMPAMAAYFETDYAIIQLSVSAYLALTGILQLIIGPLADRFGRRPVMLSALVVFLLATLGCIFATNVWFFLFCRLVQTVISTGIALSRAIVRDLVPEREAASMIGYVTMGMALMPMIGPALGGALQEIFVWQATFVVLLIFGLFTLSVAWFDLSETGTNTESSFREQAKLYPQVIASRRFWGYSLASATASGCFFAFLGGAPFVASEVLGMSPAETGASFGIIALGYLIGNFITARVSTRLGLYKLMLTGGILASFGMSLALILYASGWAHPVAIFGPTIFVGLGNGMLMPTSQSGVMSVMPGISAAVAGLSSAVTIGGGAILSAITAAMLSDETGAYPMILMMLAIALSSVGFTIYTGRVEIEMRGKLP